jgi:hypothetical protein
VVSRQQRALFLTELGSPNLWEIGTMGDNKQPRNYSPHQQKIIKRYYDNQSNLKSQRLAELVGELYLSEGKKKVKAWADAAAAMAKLGVPQSRIDHLVKQGNPALVAELVKELEGKK